MIDINIILEDLKSIDTDVKSLYYKLNLIKSIDEKEIIEYIEFLLKRYKSNPTILSALISYLQISENKYILESIPLTDIEKLREGCIQQFPTDFDFYFENAYSLFAVSNRDDEAINCANKIKEKFDNTYNTFIAFYNENK